MVRNDPFVRSDEGNAALFVKRRDGMKKRDRQITACIRTAGSLIRTHGGPIRAAESLIRAAKSPRLASAIP